SRQLVVNAAPRHLLQRTYKNSVQLFVALLRADVLVHHQVERGRMRKLGSASKAAIGRVKHAPRRFQNCADHRGGYLAPALRRRFRPRDCALDHPRLFQHLAMLLAIGCRDRKQHALKAGPAVSIVRREVSPAIKRLAIRSKKRGQRPPALSRKRSHRDLVPAVNIRTLVSIYFHRDEMLVDDRRHFRIVIRLAIHHMTPVTPHRSNVQQYRLVRRPSSGKSLLSKFMPLNRLMHSRAQIRGRSASKRVMGSVLHPASLARKQGCWSFRNLASTASC